MQRARTDHASKVVKQGLTRMRAGEDVPGFASLKDAMNIRIWACSSAALLGWGSRPSGPHWFRGGPAQCRPSKVNLN